MLIAGQGQFLVASLGSWKDATNKCTAIDDADDGSFAKPFGTITEIWPHFPSLIAVVCARGVIEFDASSSTSGTHTPAGTSSEG